MEVAGLEEFKALVRRVEAVEEENTLLKSLLLAERWISRKQAMAAIGCKVDKIRQLTATRKITYRKEGKTPFYCVFSVRDYLAAQKIDRKEIDKRLLSAHFIG